MSIDLLDNGKAWAVGYDGEHTDRIFFSKDHGENWEPMGIRGNGFTLKALTFYDTLHGWAVGSNGLMIRTTNAGNSWELLKPPTGSELHEVRFADSNVGYVAAKEGILDPITREVKGKIEIFCTRDGGDTWRRCYSENEPGRVFQILTRSASTAFVVLDGNRIIRTDDQGKTWKKVSLSMKYVFSIAFTPSGVGWIVGDGGTFLRSDDGGATWQEPASLNADFLNRRWWDVGFNSDGTGLAVGDDGTLAMTTDNGASWELQKMPVSEHLRAVRIRDSWAVVLGSQNVYTLRLIGDDRPVAP